MMKYSLFLLLHEPVEGMMTRGLRSAQRVLRSVGGRHQSSAAAGVGGGWFSNVAKRFGFDSTSKRMMSSKPHHPASISNLNPGPVDLPHTPKDHIKSRPNFMFQFISAKIQEGITEESLQTFTDGMHTLDRTQTGLEYQHIPSPHFEQIIKSGARLIDERFDKLGAIAENYKVLNRQLGQMEKTFPALAVLSSAGLYTADSMLRCLNVGPNYIKRNPAVPPFTVTKEQIIDAMKKHGITMEELREISQSQELKAWRDAVHLGCNAIAGEIDPKRYFHLVDGTLSHVQEESIFNGMVVKLAALMPEINFRDLDYARSCIYGLDEMISFWKEDKHTRLFGALLADAHFWNVVDEVLGSTQPLLEQPLRDVVKQPMPPHRQERPSFVFGDVNTHEQWHDIWADVHKTLDSSPLKIPIQDKALLGSVQDAARKVHVACNNFKVQMYTEESLFRAHQIFAYAQHLKKNGRFDQGVLQIRATGSSAGKG